MTDPDRDSPNFVRDTVVVGASAGGIQALRTIVRALPSPFPAAVLIVLHIGNHPSTLAAILRASGPHPVIEAADGEIVRPGHLYVAVPDRHLLLEYDRIRLSRGPRENHTRPAIDPLFRSAALTRGSRVIGALLTGRLDDGVAGLQATRECGGVVVVQDPSSAEEPGMPTEALKSVVVDRVAPLESLAAVLAELVGQAAPASQAAPEVPVRLSREHAIALGEGAIVEELNAVGRTSKFTCPDCGGVAVADRSIRTVALSLPHRACLFDADAARRAIDADRAGALVGGAHAAGEVDDAAPGVGARAGRAR